MNKVIRLLKKLLNNDYIFSVLNKGVSIIIGIFSSILINRYLGPELKGEYAYICNIISLTVIVANLGFYKSYPNMKRQGMEHQQQKYLDVFALQFLVYAVICIILALAFRTRLMIAIVLVVPVQVLASQLAMVALVDFLKFRQRLQIVASFVNLALYFIVYLTMESNVLIGIALLFVKDLLFVVVYMIKIRYLPNPFKIEWSFIKYLFSFGIYAMLAALLGKLNYKVDVIMMKSMMPSYAEIGLYSVGAALAEYAWLIPDAFKDVLFARTAKSDSVNSVIMAIKINMVIIVCILAFVVVFGKSLIVFMYGIEYIDSYSVTCTIFLGIPSMVLFKLISPLYLANGKQRMYFIVMLCSVASNLIMNFICIPILGKVGAALASVVSYSVCGLVFYYRFTKDYKIKWYEPFILRKNDIADLTARVKKLRHK